ncbi:MAG: hypothetical protein MJE77_15540 [Proteobacteria bacterium]|nr:hypothetical protein [Pseudomonadota bacterium]
MRKSKKQQGNKKLRLNAETIRLMDSKEELAAVRGGTCLEPTLAGDGCTS